MHWPSLKQGAAFRDPTSHALLQAHAAAAALQEAEGEQPLLDPCSLGGNLYDVAVATLARVQGLCANPHGLSKWALEMLHDQGWKVRWRTPSLAPGLYTRCQRACHSAS